MIQNKLKILFIHHAVGWGGAPKSMINIINNLDRNHFEAEVLLLKHSEIINKLNENNIKYSCAESLFYKKYYELFTHSDAWFVKWYQILLFIRKSTIWLLSRFIYAKKVLAKHEYDIVHLNSSALTDWLCPAKRKGKVIMHIREPFRKGNIDFLYYFFRKQMCKYADCLIAISNDNAKRINLPNKTYVVYNFEELPLKHPQKNSYNSKKFLYLGGQERIKGFYTLIEALNYINDGIVIYFGGHYNQINNSNHYLKRSIKKLLGVGKKERSALSKLYNHPKAVIIGMTHDINLFFEQVCCLISPFSTPHFSRPIIEAFLNRKTVITTNLSGIDEIVSNNYNGIILKENSPIKLAEAINYLANHSDVAESYGINGFQMAIECFSTKNINSIHFIYNMLYET